MFDPMFVPPRESALLRAVAGVILKPVAISFGGLYDVQIREQDRERLAALGGSRALLCPNHPTETDPIVLYWVGRKVGQRFNFLATRETLDGARGWALNRLGVYSVIRGFPDRESLRMSRRLLAELDRKVVMFPEGQIYEHNDLLLDFHSGVAQIGFWALEDLVKAGKEPRLPLVPIGIRYRCRGACAGAIAAGLADLERALGLRHDAALSSYRRLLRAGGAVLERVEREEGLRPGEGEALGARIAAVRRRILQRVAEAVGGGVDWNAPPADQLHETFNRLKAWVGVPGEGAAEYDERRYHHRLQVATPLFEELLRLQNFIAVTGDYVAAEPTAERFLEVLGRLQLEVLGKVRHRVPLEAVVRVAPPIAMEEQFEEYRRQKRATVAAVTQRLEAEIRRLLQETRALATPIELGETAAA